MIIKDSMFREYDVRGIYGDDLVEQTVKHIGFCFALLMQKKGAKKIAVGFDARSHSPIIFDWIISGVNKAGLVPVSLGLTTTGVNYFANFLALDIDASIMITGSHNPKEYNGFKFTAQKKPFFAQEIQDLKALIASSNDEILDDKFCENIDINELYINYMLKEFAHLKDLKQDFVFDCGNGVAGIVLEPILKKLGIKHKFLFETPDGEFPNHHPDPSDEKNLSDVKREILANNFALGFAFDGDADRIAVLSKANNFKGDMLAIFFAKSMKNPLVIGEVKCSQVMYDEINKIGECIMYKTGHSNLKEMLIKTKANLAAEVSGHLFFNDRYFGVDDAVYASLRVLELVLNGVDLDKELEILPKTFITPEINVRVKEEEKFEIIKALQKSLQEALQNPPANFPKILKIYDLDGVRVVFEHGWGLVRPSNTTPLITTRFEADSPQRATSYQDALLNLAGLK